MSRRRHGIRSGCVRTEFSGKHSKMTAFCGINAVRDRTAPLVREFPKTPIGGISLETKRTKNHRPADGCRTRSSARTGGAGWVEDRAVCPKCDFGWQMKPRPKEEWAELLRQTSGIANNINQITRRMNSGEPIREETLQLIADMQAQIWEKLKEF